MSGPPWRRVEQVHALGTVLAVALGAILYSDVLLALGGISAVVGVWYWPARRHEELISEVEEL